MPLNILFFILLLNDLTSNKSPLNILQHRPILKTNKKKQFMLVPLCYSTNPHNWGTVYAFEIRIVDIVFVYIFNDWLYSRLSCLQNKLFIRFFCFVFLYPIKNYLALRSGKFSLMTNTFKTFLLIILVFVNYNNTHPRHNELHNILNKYIVQIMAKFITGWKHSKNIP